MHQLKHFIKHFLTAKRNGHGIHSPFAYKLCEEVFYNTLSFYDFEELNKIRQQLLEDEQVLEIQDLGAGSKTFSGNKRKIKNLVLNGTSNTKQSELLYKLINFLNCQNCIELGTSIGLNTLYLAKANKNAKVISIEGSKDLVEFASKLASKNKTENIQFMNANFDDVFSNLINNTKSLDFLYVDGNHRYEATLNYFNLALEKKNNNSVFVFDDIYWSKGMTKAWKQIQQHSSVTLSIDTFYFGLVFFREEIKEKIDLRFYL